MKTKISINSDLLRRLNCASFNGSVIATDILSLIRIHRNHDISTLVGDKRCNYFNSVVVKSNTSNVTQVRIEISYCSKDLTNPSFPDYGNPDAPFLPENRSRCNPTTFAKFFLDIEHADYSQADWAFFDSAIRLSSKVTYVLSSKMSEIEHAYNEENYTNRIETECVTLHNSCMRYANKARNAADFYSHLAGASILYAKDEEGNVLARAIVWRNVTTNDLEIDDTGTPLTFSFIERTYFTYNFLLVKMREYAIAHGIHFRKTRNDYESTKLFTSLISIYKADGSLLLPSDIDLELSVYKPIPAVRWHKKGAPYCDTMCYMLYSASKSQLYISNYKNIRAVAEMRSTSGFASSVKSICPVCGNVHDSGYGVCEDCKKEYIKDTPFGKVLATKTRRYRKLDFPTFCFHGKQPTTHLLNHMALQQLRDC